MSPLGRYAEGVAAIVSLALVATFLVMVVLGQDESALVDDLKDMVLLALGYVFVKGGVQAGEKRAEAAQAAATESAAQVVAPPPHTHTGEVPSATPDP